MARRSERSGRRVAREAEARRRTILAAGVVHALERLHDLADIERVRLRGLPAQAARAADAVDAIVIGTVAPPSAAIDAIAELRRVPESAAIPLLHLVASDSGCGTCGADVCLPVHSSGAALVGVVKLLLGMGPRGSAALEADLQPGEIATTERLVALGRLAVGIVHDFNNLLLVIAGHVELARRLLGEGHPATVRLATVLHAVERAAALNRQLLTLGRPAPAGEPLSEVDAVVAQLEPMLQRVLGAHVRLVVQRGSARGLVKAGPTELEQLLLNLVLNARDAMPGGGRLSIETQDVLIVGGIAPPVPPGRYVMLAISDEGVGIAASTRERIFEPFFTTKAVGEGSGLGLATVHRVAQRAGGHVQVDSEPGLGSTFRVYLPRAGEPAERDAPDTRASAPGGRETVLLVDGSEAVRAVTRELLEGLGYTVLTASNAEEALRVAQEHPQPIDVVLADAALPGLRGRALAEQLAVARPHTRVLLMAADANGGLAKPFTRDLLARAVRDALDVRIA